MAYTPVLKSTYQRMTIANPVFSDGFRDDRIVRTLKGIVTDADTGKRYKIYGKACNIPGCACDAFAVELSA
jgi:hypothetical protein